MDRDDLRELLERLKDSEGRAGYDLELRYQQIDTPDVDHICTGNSIYSAGAIGQVLLERAVNLGVRKGTVTIEALEKGRVLGCWSTLLGERHLLMSSAICQKPTRLLTMRGADLRHLMHSNKELGFNVMEKFCFLLRDRVQAAYGALEKI